MEWLIAITQKAAAFPAAQCANRLVALIGKMPNSVHGWILTGFAKARLAYAIGVNAGMKMNSGGVNGTGGRTMKMPLLERIRMWWYKWIIRHVCHHTYDCCKDFLKDCRTCVGKGWGGID